LFVLAASVDVAMIALSGGGIAALQAFASEILDFSMTGEWALMIPEHLIYLDCNL
jgi:hypothetical protein